MCIYKENRLLGDLWRRHCWRSPPSTFLNPQIPVSSMYWYNDEYEESETYIYCEPKCRALHHWHMAARRYTEAVQWRAYQHLGNSRPLEFCITPASRQTPPPESVPAPGLDPGPPPTTLSSSPQSPPPTHTRLELSTISYSRILIDYSNGVL